MFLPGYDNVKDQATNVLPSFASRLCGQESQEVADNPPTATGRRYTELFKIQNHEEAYVFRKE